MVEGGGGGEKSGEKTHNFEETDSLCETTELNRVSVGWR
jgi:hypothetical protein